MFSILTVEFQGNPVGIGDGPATVNGDENGTTATEAIREGAVSRLIRKSEDPADPQAFNFRI